MSEAQLHRAVADFLDAALCPGATWFHVPNSIWTSPRQAATHKAFGMKAGVGDCIVVAIGLPPLALELKTSIGHMSTAQQKWAAEWRRAGGSYRVCRSLEDVERELLAHGLGLRATLNGGADWRKVAA